jgi:SPP1 gp7 family putative phage head morphogenesis protein
LLLKIHIAGAVSGEKLLPANLRVLVNWDRVNAQAIKWLNGYRLNTEGLASVIQTTRNRTIDAIEDWIRSGEPLPNLEPRLARWYDDQRARQIAVTEVTRVYAEGNRQSWKSTGMVGANRWNTANDELVCPICGPLHNVEVPLDEGFTPDGPGEGPTAPPAHVNCRCWLTPVVSLENVGDEIARAIEEA